MISAGLRRWLLVSLGLAAVLVGAVVLPVSSHSEVIRLEAGDPVEAGLAVSRHIFADGATDHVVLVRHDVFADALVAGPLTGELPGGAPVLLTPRDHLDGRVAEEVGRVTGGAGTVHIVGGEAAVSHGVADALRDAGHRVQRIAGRDRIATALAVFDTFFADDVDGGDVMVARAFGPAGTPEAEAQPWADAMAGGGYGAAQGVPVLLTRTGTLPTSVRDAVDRAGVGTAVVLGGRAAVGRDVESALSEVVATIRVAGRTREGTAVAIAHELYGIEALTAGDAVLVVNGHSGFAFALAANAHAATGSPTGLDAPLLLVAHDAPTGDIDCADGGTGPEASACYLARNGTEPGPVVIVGDTSQVSEAVASRLAELRG